MLSFFERLFHRSPTAPADRAEKPALPEASWLIVGLGNPGPKYEATRHNVGFMAVDELGADLNSLPGYRADVGRVGDALVVRPTTFMNLSGEAVGPIARELGVPPENVVVIHDELDLPAGTVRLKRGGNENGHNGLKSISENLGTRDYVRVRIGISRPPQGVPVPDYVLGAVDEDLGAALSDAAEGARLVVTQGLQRAQNVIHARRK